MKATPRNPCRQPCRAAAEGNPTLPCDDTFFIASKPHLHYKRAARSAFDRRGDLSGERSRHAGGRARLAARDFRDRHAGGPTPDHSHPDVHNDGAFGAQPRAPAPQTFPAMGGLISDTSKLKAATSTNDPQTVQVAVADIQKQLTLSPNLLLVTGKSGGVLAKIGR